MSNINSKKVIKVKINEKLWNLDLKKNYKSVKWDIKYVRKLSFILVCLHIYIYFIIIISRNKYFCLMILFAFFFFYYLTTYNVGNIFLF